MQEIYRGLARMTQNDLTVMIFGESGTAKSLLRVHCMISRPVSIINLYQLIWPQFQEN